MCMFVLACVYIYMYTYRYVCPVPRPTRTGELLFKKVVAPRPVQTSCTEIGTEPSPARPSQDLPSIPRPALVVFFNNLYMYIHIYM